MIEMNSIRGNCFLMARHLKEHICAFPILLIGRHLASLKIPSDPSANSEPCLIEYKSINERIAL
jgi:hypothetical protein